jgi:hypothetical protein
MDPDVFLEQLKTSAGTRKAKSLDILHEVCREQFKRGSKDFSVGTIGRLSGERGGLATQSIRNATGDDFKALVSVWANHTGGSEKRQPKVHETPLYAVLEKIPDPAVRAVIGPVLAENKKLKGEVNLLKRNAQIVIDQRPTAGRAGEGKGGVQVVLAGALTDTEKEALRHACSSKLLQDEGWHVDESGRVLSQIPPAKPGA